MEVLHFEVFTLYASVWSSTNIDNMKGFIRRYNIYSHPGEKFILSFKFANSGILRKLDYLINPV